MSWLILSILAHFLGAWVAILDKLILKRTIFEVTPYVFFSGIMSIFTVILIIPASRFIKILGVFSAPSLPLILFDFSIGIVLLLALFCLFTVLSRAEASRAMTFIGGLIPIFTFGSSFFIFGERLEGARLLAFLFLIAGSALIAFSYSAFRISGALRYAALSAFLWAVFYILIKLAFAEQSFVTTIFWMETGVFGSALLLLLRRDVREQIGRVSVSIPAKKSHLLLFIFNKTLARASSLLIILAVNLGSLALVNAFEGVKYASVFLIAVLFSTFWPRFLKEELTLTSVLQKSFAIFFISIGIFILIYQ